MITVVVVGVLAAIAYPSYMGQVRKSRRAEAQQVLMDLASRQQQYLLDTRSYGADTASIGGMVTSSAQSFYTITWSVNNSSAPQSFTVTATPRSGTTQAQDSCGAMTVNEAGVRTPSSCW